MSNDLAASGYTARKPHLFVGGWRADVRDRGDDHFTPPHSRGARWFRSLDEGTMPLGELHLGTGTGYPPQYGGGPLVELVSGDPDWWDAVIADATKTRDALRSLLDGTESAG